jgi:hypothetical protein
MNNSSSVSSSTTTPLSSSSKPPHVNNENKDSINIDIITINEKVNLTKQHCVLQKTIMSFLGRTIVAAIDSTEALQNR